MTIRHRWQKPKSHETDAEHRPKAMDHFPALLGNVFGIKADAALQRMQGSAGQIIKGALSDDDDAEAAVEQTADTPAPTLDPQFTKAVERAAMPDLTEDDIIQFVIWFREKELGSNPRIETRKPVWLKKDGVFTDASFMWRDINQDITRKRIQTSATNLPDLITTLMRPQVSPTELIELMEIRKKRKGDYPYGSSTETVYRQNEQGEFIATPYRWSDVEKFLHEPEVSAIFGANTLARFKTLHGMLHTPLVKPFQIKSPLPELQ